MKIACVMAKRFEIELKSAHLDGTSISVHGKYLQPSASKVEQSSSVEELLPQASLQEDGQRKEEEDCELVPITITHCYSRDHRPELKQYTLNLLTAESEGIPLF